MNAFTTFVEDHQIWKWDISGGMSRNPAVDMEFIESHPTWKWNMFEVAKNPNLTPKYIDEHINDKKWGLFVEGLAENPNITPEFIRRHSDWKWRDYAPQLSYNPNLTIEFIEQRSNWDWHTDGLVKNPLLTPEFVKNNNSAYGWWCKSRLRFHPAFSDAIKSDPTNPIWCRYGTIFGGWDLKYDPNITSELVGHIYRHGEDWNIGDTVGYLSMNPHLDSKFIEQYPKLPWNAAYLSSNPGITPTFIENHPEIKWDHFAMSSNPNLTPVFIERHLNWNWHMPSLSANPFTAANKVWKKVMNKHLPKFVIKAFLKSNEDNPLKNSIYTLAKYTSFETI